MTLPLLLNPGKLGQFPHPSCECLKDRHLGRLAERLGDDAAREAAEALINGGRVPQGWHEAVARELLLASSWSRDVPEWWWERFAAVRPFTDGPPLAELRRLPLAMAVFPIDSTEEIDPIPPLRFFTFCFQGSVGTDHRRRLGVWPTAEAEGGLDGISLFLAGDLPEAETCPILRGHSWTLAIRLALRALQGSPQERESLAREWLITGRAGGNGEVGMIGVGNKVEIQTGRSWMFPPQNRPDLVGRALSLGAVQFPATVDSAWALVRGDGIVHRGEVEWPAGAPVLHSFTSLAWKPVVASILLARPRRVVLWHTASKDSESRAQAIREFFCPGSRGDEPDAFVRLEMIPSDDLVAIQEKIKPVLEDDLRDPVPVLFNITQGTRFMSFAALAFAQLHPHLWLVYRDFDSEKGVFRLIRYEGLLPSVEDIPCPDQAGLAMDLGGTAWEVLFANAQRPPGELDIVAELGGQAVAGPILEKFFKGRNIASPVSSI